MNITDAIRGRLVVSCQAAEASPFRDAGAMSAMALAAILGGASALRLESIDHVHQMSGLGVPVVGLIKRREPGSEVYITPTARDVEELALAGATVVAMDATSRVRPGNERLSDLVRTAHELGLLVMGDADSVASAVFAEQSGVDWVGTTLSGYTTPRLSDGPDTELVGKMVQSCDVPVIAEGRYTLPDQITAAFAAGAWAVVVGTAISDPVQTARRFVQACPGPMGVVA